MIRNLKALGLAMVAVFAMSAVAAAAAHAEFAHFKADSTSTFVKIHATQDPTGGAEQVFTTNFGEVNCDILTATGTSDNTASSVTLDSISYTADYFEESNACEAFGLEATINFNGCEYVFHAGTYDGEGMSTGTADLVCPPGKEVEINAAGLCVVSVPGQTGLGNITYQNGGGTPQDVTVEANVGVGGGKAIRYSGAGLLCSGTFENGTYTGKATVTAVEDATGEKPVAVTIVPAETGGSE
jgi:hypothetical protein